jgi:hypothetical protein
MGRRRRQPWPRSFRRCSSRGARGDRCAAGLVLLHVVCDDAVVSLAKAHVSLHPVDKAYEDSTEEVHEQYTQRVAPKGGRTWRSKFWPHEVDTRQGET